MRVQSSDKKSSVSNFRGLQVWQKARELVKKIYLLTERFPKEETYGLVSQMRRAAISVMSNLAEGSSKRSTREFIRFINMSYGSLAELEAQTIVSVDLGFTSDQQADELYETMAEIGRMLNALKVGLNRKLNSELLNSHTLNEDA